MNPYDEIVAIHNPNLFGYTILLAHEDEDDGTECLGTGVMVAIGGRHLIATAAHCIRRNPRVMREKNFIIDQHYKIATRPPVKILDRWLHPTLDIGFLEVAEALGPEMSEGQLHCDPLKKVGDEGGQFYIVGYPACRQEVNESLKEITLEKSGFGSIVIEQTDEWLKLNYPVTGYRFEGGRWVPVPFIERPHGFSGGGCFEVISTTGTVPAISYKLVGVQSSWSPRERWVEVVPIRHWLVGVKSHLN